MGADIIYNGKMKGSSILIEQNSMVNEAKKCVDFWGLWHSSFLKY